MLNFLFEFILYKQNSFENRVYFLQHSCIFLQHPDAVTKLPELTISTYMPEAVVGQLFPIYVNISGTQSATTYELDVFVNANPNDTSMPWMRIEHGEIIHVGEDFFWFASDYPHTYISNVWIIIGFPFFCPFSFIISKFFCK